MHSNTCRKYIFTNSYLSDFTFRNLILYTTISDHSPVFHITREEQPNRTIIVITKTNTNDNSKQKLK